MTHTDHGNHTVGVPLLLVLLLAVGYELLSMRRPWSPWRAASFMTGCAVLILGLTVDSIPVRLPPVLATRYRPRCC